MNQNTVPAAWWAVFAMSLGIFGIVGAEFLPASLLTPMAADLNVTEGMAGQSVTATAAFGFLASLFISLLAGERNRRNILIFFAVLLVVSNLSVALASNFTVLLIARIVLGVALGGFWALSPAVILRLVPEDQVPKALAILFGGVSAATVFAAPFGTFLGDMFGWRTVFYAAALLGMLSVLSLYITLPSLPSKRTENPKTILTLLSRQDVFIGMLSLLLVFIGHFSFFTYLRPFLEDVTHASPIGVTITLLIFGIGTFCGNAISSKLINFSLKNTLIVMPLCMGTLAVLLSTLGGNQILDCVFIAAWGVLFGIVPVSWSTWVTKAMPDNTESGGGLLVATCNLAIAIGAAGGGIVLDSYNSQILYFVSALVLFTGFLLTTKLKSL